MSRRDPGWTGPRRLAALFLAVVIPPTVALLWLGLQLLRQDQALFAQRAAEREQAAVQAIVGSLEQSLTQAERWLTDLDLPEQTIRLSWSHRGIEVHPAGSLLWLPSALSLIPAATLDFDEAERAEYQGHPDRALFDYEAMTGSASRPVRAGALLRLARVHRRAGRAREAVRAYRELARMNDVAIDGMPADLLARRAVCDVLSETRQFTALAAEARSLAADFRSGRWQLERAAWELAAMQIESWTSTSLLPRPEAAVFSAVAELMTSEGLRLVAGDARPVGRHTITANGVPVTLLVQRKGAGELTAVAVLPPLVQTWLKQARATQSVTPGAVALLTDGGAVVAGAPPDTDTTRRSAADTGLPWAIAIEPPDATGLALELAQRRRLLLAGLLALVALLSGGSFLLWRLLQRELAVARLQTNFVAAVSHEFRTPLASLRHVTELLDEHDELPLERRRAFYNVLARNADRLHRLVESLLDFARMENGRKPYNLEPVNLTTLAAHVVADFRSDGRSGGVAIEFEDASGPAVESLADAASLTHALWNLLDNAVKYSPEGRPVHVSVERHPAGAAICVRDNGLGIPRSEQKEIFRKFVRGRRAAELGIKGTGLGLAMVDHIVRAHGGAIELESEEGVGSTFRLVLPEAA